MRGTDVISTAVGDMSTDELRSMKSHFETGATICPLSYFNDPKKRALAIGINGGIIEPDEILLEIKRALAKVTTDQK